MEKYEFYNICITFLSSPFKANELIKEQEIKGNNIFQLTQVSDAELKNNISGDISTKFEWKFVFKEKDEMWNRDECTWNDKI